MNKHEKLARSAAETVLHRINETGWPWGNERIDDETRQLFVALSLCHQLGWIEARPYNWGYGEGWNVTEAGRTELDALPWTKAMEHSPQVTIYGPKRYEHSRNRPSYRINAEDWTELCRVADRPFWLDRNFVELNSADAIHVATATAMEAERSIGIKEAVQALLKFSGGIVVPTDAPLQTDDLPF